MARPNHPQCSVILSRSEDSLLKSKNKDENFPNE
jgi:hypothetical protein